MAYAPTRDGTRPGPGDPGVIWCLCDNSDAETNIAIKVPWDDVRLAYAYSAVVVAIDNNGASEVDFELNVAGGTEMASMQIAQNAGVGTITEATIDPNYKLPLSSADSVVIEIDGASSATGKFMVFMYFEQNVAS